MQTSHLRAPLSRALFASLCLTLPAACGIEDVIITPDPPGTPDSPDHPCDGPDAGPPEPPPPPPPPPDSPELQAVYYDYFMFAQEIQPGLDNGGCSLLGCHSIEGPGTGLLLFPNPTLGSYEMWSNLLSVTSFVDLASDPFSAEDNELYFRASDLHRGIQFPDLDALLAWIDDAAARYAEDHQPIDEPFDVAVFESEVAPLFDASCAFAGCHAVDASATDFALYQAPAPGSPEMFNNLRAVIERVDLSLERAEATEIYARATDRHLTVAIESPEVLAAWIQAALDADDGE